MKNFSVAVKIKMTEKGLRQKEVAAKMGLTEKKLSDALNGRKVINITMIRGICEALGVSPNELFMYKKE